MPDQPSWIHRVDSILRALQQDDEVNSYLDRPAVERLFGISSRQANRLMQRCEEPFFIGRSAVVSRRTLIALVSNWSASGEVEREHRRRKRLCEILAVERDALKSRRISIAVSSGDMERTFMNLPRGIHLEHGRLTVEFENSTELLEKLFGFVQAVSNDFDGFTQGATR